jgi:hypothetical protein
VTAQAVPNGVHHGLAFPVVTSERDAWVDCYRELKPWSSRARRDAASGSARIAIERSLALLWGQVDLRAPATDADVHAIVAASDAYNQGWFDAVIGVPLGPASNGEYWPTSLWRWIDLTYWSERRGRGRVCRDTVGEHLDLFARFDFDETLALVARAEDAARQAAGDPPERAAAAVSSLVQGAWAARDSATWDDAEWYDYLDLEDVVGWAVAALELPGVQPHLAAERALHVVEEGAWKGWKWWVPRDTDELPPELLADLAEAVAMTVRESMS